MIVAPHTIPVRHNSRLYGPDEEFEIDRAGYERIANHLDVIDDSDAKSFDKMTAPELKEYAVKISLDLGEATTKPDILAKIKAAVGEGNDD
ncbi:hypothetical protein Back11_11670 [Paenibacillus baekrokdamisoli]|uniref:Uncharacterized protein n=1 Tax=Paenibacillus baekrokdamisoli TaxID=1712516 RepID=A0A3G9INL0_9BACL|nr:hypothetical protein [Paenibacillus baekrokdamisoli]MBB3070472.1 hypothetical protein [Paenibacillus baekrokdamisoli]BBH19822.1 hypothetical protein Back11_11670 [Paenibacillus baekrokdamisoli]